jgi:hypothetical protein
MGAIERYRLKPLADFLTVSGAVRQLYGVPCANSDEFFERADWIRRTALAENQPMSLDELFRADQIFAASVARCLELNGLSFNDVSLRHIQDLLLFEMGDGPDAELQAGLLVRINTPRTRPEMEAGATKKPIKEAGYANVVASLASYNKSLTEAIDLTSRLTTDELSDFIAEMGAMSAETASGGVPSMSRSEFEELERQLG